RHRPRGGDRSAPRARVRGEPNSRRLHRVRPRWVLGSVRRADAGPDGARRAEGLDHAMTATPLSDTAAALRETLRPSDFDWNAALSEGRVTFRAYKVEQAARAL